MTNVCNYSRTWTHDRLICFWETPNMYSIRFLLWLSTISHCRPRLTTVHPLPKESQCYSTNPLGTLEKKLKDCMFILSAAYFSTGRHWYFSDIGFPFQNLKNSHKWTFSIVIDCSFTGKSNLTAFIGEKTFHKIDFIHLFNAVIIQLRGF